MIKSDHRIEENINKVLESALGEEINEVSFETKTMKGGTVGDVQLVYGIAMTLEGKEIPYKVVYKRQKKWERFGDVSSWRREYDLYAANLDGIFSDSFRWPKCYYMELLEDVTHIWLEYIEGVSGQNMLPEMYECAAEELGHFQGKIYLQKPKELEELNNLNTKVYSKKFYQHYRSWNEVYDYIRSEECDIPKHLCKMLIDLDDNSDKIWSGIEQLPIVFCHRDYWVENIFYKEGKIRLIDWDTAGWGYLGEDIASLIADEADVIYMVENYRNCVAAYYRGFSEFVDISHIKYTYIKEMILFLFGYRLVEGIKFADTVEEKANQIEILEKIFDI